MNTADYLLEFAEDNHTALITDGAEYTYRDLKEASRRVLGALIAAHVAPRDRVALLAPNSPGWVAAYLAILKLGAVAVPLPTTAPPAELQRSMDFAGCRVLCIDNRSANRLAAVLGDQTRLLLDDVLAAPGLGLWPDDAGCTDTSQDAALMLTSGTTAQPRAVRVTHANIQANTDSIIEYLELERTDRMLVVLPFYYCFGASLLHTHLRIGGSLALCNTFTYPETALDMMARAACTGLAGVPSTYQTLLRNSSFPKRQFPALRKVQQAGGKLSTVLIEELIAALPGARVYVMYGQTEATARLSYLPPALLSSKLGSIGRGIPGVELRVVDASGAGVKRGEVGEIMARGGNISPGYLDDPEETARKFVNGALMTGDLATVDEDGYIYIVDRKSDFIKSYGHRVSSQEIEACVLQLPEVVAAAAVGEPDLVRGEAIMVYLTLRAGAQLSPDDVIAHCRRSLAAYMVPMQIRVVDSLPMNAHGKVVKSELRHLSPAPVQGPA